MASQVAAEAPGISIASSSTHTHDETVAWKREPWEGRQIVLILSGLIGSGKVHTLLLTTYGIDSRINLHNSYMIVDLCCRAAAPLSAIYQV